MAEAAGVLVSKDKPGRVLGDGELRLVEVLRVRLTEVRDLPTRGASDRSVFCLVRLDGRDVFQSASVPKSLNSFFGDEFSHEVRGNFGQLHFILCEQYHGRVPRPFARVSLRKNDVIKYSGQDLWYPLKPFSRHSDVSGKICLEIGYQECLNENATVSQSIRIRVLDHNDLNVPTGTRPVELYLLATLHASGNRLETKKLRVPARKSQKASAASASGAGGSSESTTTLSSSIDDAPSLTLDLDGLGSESDALERSQLRLSVWHDLLGGFNSYFHGELRIQLDERTLKPRADRQGPQWYYLKPRLSVEDSRPGSESGASSQSPSSTHQLGALRLRMSYTADHILSMARYNELWTNLTDSINHQPFFATPAGILEWLPGVDLEGVARPLMKIFVQADLIRPLLRTLYTQELSRCHDVNTLFRSSSLCSKVLYELMKFVGHQYMIISLKPIIDKIYNEKKSCEVDPAKLTPGQILEHNSNLILYAETAFSRVVDSNHRCPQALRDTFADLREVVNARFPGRIDVQRLALSSFLIMRFFAAAILNPKLFGIKRENADVTVSRTLALVSKILQRLSNCVVSAQPLTIKEQWMADIFDRLTDEKHRLAMVKFLDRISCVGGENSISGDSVSVLKEGWIIERFAREKRCLKLNWMLQKRRYVVLTETELYWSKAKTEQQNGRLILSEVNIIEPVDDSTFGGKHIFRVATASNSIYLQASNGVEMTDWLAAIQKQCRRQLMTVRQTTQLSALYDVEVDRELEAIHMSFLEHAESLKHWNNALDGASTIPDGEAPLPPILSDPTDEDAPESSAAQSGTRERFSKSLQTVLLGTMVLEKAHRDAVFRYMKQMRYGSIDNPIGDDNYLLLKSRMKDLTPDGGGGAVSV